MSESKHTPGPWMAEGGEVWSGTAFTSLVATLADRGNEQRANAALIAAAPDMYAALTAARALFDEWDEREPSESMDEAIVAIENIRGALGYFAALAKAEGR